MSHQIKLRVPVPVTIDGIECKGGMLEIPFTIVSVDFVPRDRYEWVDGRPVIRPDHSENSPKKCENCSLTPDLDTRAN